MNTAIKIKPSDFKPSVMPEIVRITAETKPETQPDETCVKQINNYCDIVDRAEFKMVGVEVKVNFLNSFSAIDTVLRYIHNGTCQLLEDTVGNKNPGQFVAAVSEAVTGSDFTYIIGVEVENFDNLPEFFPPSTVLFMAPRARYGKVTTGKGGWSQKPLPSIIYLGTKEFHDESGYYYDRNGVPLRVFDANGKMRYAYEPVKIPANEEEKFESVHYEVVVLPDTKVIGIADKDGHYCLNTFMEKEKTFDWKKAGYMNKSEYHSFMFTNDDGEDVHIFGIQVRNFERVPDFLSCATIPGGLFVKIYQEQINDDNPYICRKAKDIVFFNKHPEFMPDSSRTELWFLQDCQGGYIYFPIKKNINNNMK